MSCVPPVKKWVNSSITRLGAIAHRLNEAVRETFETLLLATHIAHGFSILDDLTQTESLPVHNMWYVQELLCEGILRSPHSVVHIRFIAIP